MSVHVAHAHCVPKDGEMWVDGRVHYQRDNPPTKLEIYGTSYRMAREYRRKWDGDRYRYVCPACTSMSIDGFAYCPECGARLRGYNGGPKDGV